MTDKWYEVSGEDKIREFAKSGDSPGPTPAEPDVVYLEAIAYEPETYEDTYTIGVSYNELIEYVEAGKIVASWWKEEQTVGEITANVYSVAYLTELVITDNHQGDDYYTAIFTGSDSFEYSSYDANDYLCDPIVESEV